VQELHFPQYFTPEQRETRARTWLNNIKRTDRIVVSYEHVKNDIIKYFDFDKDKIHVILLNMRNLWFSSFSKNDIENTSPKHGFKSFLLYPANTWQHKNHLRLLDAIASLRDEYQINVNLVCVGNQNNHFRLIKNRINKLNLTSQVRFLGIVNEKVLYSLYQECTGVVIPTTYEAGSFPLMESILMEVPVICSNVTSLPETIGDEIFIFNPSDIHDIAKKIRQLWCDENYRHQNIENSKIMSDHLVDTNVLGKLEELYDEI
jgi:glycosyltransferase involved in cell wall biosynthesis